MGNLSVSTEPGSRQCSPGPLPIDMDDSDRDGVADNGLWNGMGDATKR